MKEKLKTYTIKQALIDNVYRDYNRCVNMSFYELRKWIKDLRSMKINPKGRNIRHSLELLRINKNKWDMKHVRWAIKTIKIVKRLKNTQSGSPLSYRCPYSKKTILLKNLGYDPNKK